MIVLVHMVHPDDFCRSWRHHCGLSKKKRLADLRTLRTHRLRRPTKRRRHAWPVATRCEVTAVGNCGTVSSTDSRPHSTEVTKSFSCFHSTCFAWPNLFTRDALWLQSLPRLGQAVCVLGVGGVFVFPSRSSAWNPEKTESQKTYRSFWLGRWLRGLLGGRHLSNST